MPIPKNEASPPLGADDATDDERLDSLANHLKSQFGLVEDEPLPSEIKKLLEALDSKSGS